MHFFLFFLFLLPAIVVWVLDYYYFILITTSSLWSGRLCHLLGQFLVIELFQLKQYVKNKENGFWLFKSKKRI